MDTIKISETKLKVMLSKEDMENYHLAGGELDSENPVSRECLRTVIKDAGKRLGIDCGKRRMFIQLYAVRSGGCEIFVTLLSGEKNTLYHHSTETEDFMAKSALAEAKSIGERCKELPDIYRFCDFEALLSLCRRLDGRKKKLRQSGGASSLFSERDKKIYYLVIYGEEDLQYIIDEYGGEKKSISCLIYIHEHCKSIVKGDAIETLSVLF